MERANRIAIVTGGGSGIGRVAARALADEGITVVVCGRRIAPLEALAGEPRPGSGGIVAHACDVADPASVRDLFAWVDDRFGRLDLLFNNAGVGAPDVPIDELEIDAWLDTIAINLTGSFLCSREAFARMKSQKPAGGRIINNGSVSAHVPRLHSAPYTASKHGIAGLTRATALEGRSHQISCCQIDIGNALTERTSRMADGVLQADGARRVEPTFDVRHVAEAIRYLANLPLDVSVPFMTVMATGMPYIGRG